MISRPNPEQIEKSLNLGYTLYIDEEITVATQANAPPPPQPKRQVKILEKQRETTLFRTNRSLAVRLPPDFGAPGDSVRIARDGERLIIEPIAKSTGLLALLSEWAHEVPLDETEQFPANINETLLPAKDLNL